MNLSHLYHREYIIDCKSAAINYTEKPPYLQTLAPGYYYSVH